MTTTRRKFTPEERLSILQEGEREGHSSPESDLLINCTENLL